MSEKWRAVTGLWSRPAGVTLRRETSHPGNVRQSSSLPDHAKSAYSIINSREPRPRVGFVRWHLVLRRNIPSKLRASRQTEQEIIRSLSAEFEVLGVRLEGVTLDALEKVVARNRGGTAYPLRHYLLSGRRGV